MGKVLSAEYIRLFSASPLAEDDQLAFQSDYPNGIERVARDTEVLLPTGLKAASSAVAQSWNHSTQRTGRGLGEFTKEDLRRCFSALFRVATNEDHIRDFRGSELRPWALLLQMAWLLHTVVLWRFNVRVQLGYIKEDEDRNIVATLLPFNRSDVNDDVDFHVWIYTAHAQATDGNEIRFEGVKERAPPNDKTTPPKPNAPIPGSRAGGKEQQTSLLGDSLRTMQDLRDRVDYQTDFPNGSVRIRLDPDDYADTFPWQAVVESWKSQRPRIEMATGKQLDDITYLDMNQIYHTRTKRILSFDLDTLYDEDDHATWVPLFEMSHAVSEMLKARFDIRVQLGVVHNHETEGLVTRLVPMWNSSEPPQHRLWVYQHHPESTELILQSFDGLAELPEHTSTKKSKVKKPTTASNDDGRKEGHKTKPRMQAHVSGSNPPSPSDVEEEINGEASASDPPPPSHVQEEVNRKASASNPPPPSHAGEQTKGKSSASNPDDARRQPSSFAENLAATYTIQPRKRIDDRIAQAKMSGNSHGPATKRKAEKHPQDSQPSGSGNRPPKRTRLDKDSSDPKNTTSEESGLERPGSEQTPFPSTLAPSQIEYVNNREDVLEHVYQDVWVPDFKASQLNHWWAVTSGQIVKNNRLNVEVINEDTALKFAIIEAWRESADRAAGQAQPGSGDKQEKGLTAEQMLANSRSLARLLWLEPRPQLTYDSFMFNMSTAAEYARLRREIPTPAHPHEVLWFEIFVNRLESYLEACNLQRVSHLRALREMPTPKLMANISFQHQDLEFALQDAEADPGLLERDGIPWAPKNARKETDPERLWREQFESDFPFGPQPLETEGTRLYCAMHALQLSIQHQFPLVPVPTVQQLHDLAKSQYAESPYITTRDRNQYTVDQALIAGRAWLARSGVDARVGIARTTADDVFYAAASPAPPPPPPRRRRVLWILDDDVAARADRGAAHFSGLRAVGARECRERVAPVSWALARANPRTAEEWRDLADTLMAHDGNPESLGERARRYDALYYWNWVRTQMERWSEPPLGDVEMRYVLPGNALARMVAEWRREIRLQREDGGLRDGEASRRSRDRQRKSPPDGNKGGGPEQAQAGTARTTDQTQPVPWSEWLPARLWNRLMRR